MITPHGVHRKIACRTAGLIMAKSPAHKAWLAKQAFNPDQYTNFTPVNLDGITGPYHPFVATGGDGQLPDANQGFDSSTLNYIHNNYGGLKTEARRAGDSEDFVLPALNGGAVSVYNPKIDRYDVWWGGAPQSFLGGDGGDAGPPPQATPQIMGSADLWLPSYPRMGAWFTPEIAKKQFAYGAMPGAITKGLPHNVGDLTAEQKAAFGLTGTPDSHGLRFTDPTAPNWGIVAYKKEGGFGMPPSFWKWAAAMATAIGVAYAAGAVLAERFGALG